MDSNDKKYWEDASVYIVESFQALVSDFHHQGLSIQDAIAKACTEIEDALAGTGPQHCPLPGFDEHGYLPATLMCSIDEVRSRFGVGSVKRAQLMEELQHVLDDCQTAQVKRMILGGSFITNRESPNDVDLTILVGQDFDADQSSGNRNLIEDYTFSNSWKERGVHLFLVDNLKSFWRSFHDYARPKEIEFYAPGVEYTGVVEVVL